MVSLLYKYVKECTAVENMIQGRLKFTNYSKLNDPNEMFAGINWREVKNSLTALRVNGYTEEDYQWLCRQNILLNKIRLNPMGEGFPENKDAATRRINTYPFYENENLMRTFQTNIVQGLRDKVGILSLSETYQSFPMWAHYAESGRGFVVVLKNLDELFNGDETGSLNQLMNVDYVDIIKGMTFDPSTQNRLFFSKLNDWSYEKEWRVILPLSVCNQDEYHNHIYQIDKKYIAGVICGWRSSMDDIHRIERTVNSCNQQGFIHFAEVNDSQINEVDHQTNSRL